MIKTRLIFLQKTIIISLLICFTNTNFAQDIKNHVVHLSQKEFLRKIDNSDTVVIDIRTTSEYKNGYIGKAVNIPHTDIINNISLLDQYKEKNIIFYCHSGGRVKRIANYLQQENYLTNKPVYHLKGDIRAWQGKGLPLSK